MTCGCHKGQIYLTKIVGLKRHVDRYIGGTKFSKYGEIKGNLGALKHEKTACYHIITTLPASISLHSLIKTLLT